jgi:hypothetical protein
LAEISDLHLVNASSYDIFLAAEAAVQEAIATANDIAAAPVYLQILFMILSSRAVGGY